MAAEPRVALLLGIAAIVIVLIAAYLLIVPSNSSSSTAIDNEKPYEYDNVYANDMGVTQEQYRTEEDGEKVQDVMDKAFKVDEVPNPSLLRQSTNTSLPQQPTYIMRNNWNIHDPLLPPEKQCEGNFSSEAAAREACSSRSDCVGFVKHNGLQKCGVHNRYELRASGPQMQWNGVSSWIKQS